jgi:hypothetical protein
LCSYEEITPAFEKSEHRFPISDGSLKYGIRATESIQRIFLGEKKLNIISAKHIQGDCMPTSKKQLEKLNKVKKAKAEELSKQVAAGSQDAKKKLQKLEKKMK